MSKSEKSDQGADFLNLKPADDSERRRSKRFGIVETFSLFIVLPPRPDRLKIIDLSDAGIGFELDAASDYSEEFKQGMTSDVRLYLNQSLYLPLRIEIRRIVEQDGVRRIGAQFTSKGSQGHIALLAFLDMLDAVSESGQIDQQA